MLILMQLPLDFLFWGELLGVFCCRAFFLNSEPVGIQIFVDGFWKYLASVLLMHNVVICIVQVLLLVNGMGKKEPRPEFLSRPPACLEPSSVVEINSNNSGVGNERAMAVEARDLQNRLREQVTQLLGENSTFQRLMYKSCNQHRRATYFRRLVQVLYVL